MTRHVWLLSLGVACTGAEDKDDGLADSGAGETAETGETGGEGDSAETAETAEDCGEGPASVYGTVSWSDGALWEVGEVALFEPETVTEVVSDTLSSGDGYRIIYSAGDYLLEGRHPACTTERISVTLCPGEQELNLTLSCPE